MAKNLNFTFAVIGDTHYINKKYHQKALRRGLVEDVERYNWMRTHVAPSIFSEIRQHRPEFVVQLGDLAEGGCDADKLSQYEMEEAWGQISYIGAPVFMAKGNHDTEIVYREVILPLLSKNLGTKLKTNYYSFDYDNNSFIFVDYLGLTEGNQQYLWLKGELERCQKADRIFIFAHAPLFPIARPFFSELSFIRPMLNLLEQYPVDVYFCGHTHNQSATLHHYKGKKILQMMGSIIGFPQEELITLKESRNLFCSPEECEYYWGFLEDSAPSYFIVKIVRDLTYLSWYVLGKGQQGIIEWGKRGNYHVIKKPKGKRKIPINSSDLKRIKSAYLHMCLYGSSGENKLVFLNGTEIGSAPIAGAFAPRKGINISKEKIKYIKMENTIEIHNPDKELFTTGSICLEITLDNGQKVRTNVSPYIYTTTHKWDNWGLDILRYVEPGRMIGPIFLKFGGNNCQ